MYAKHKFRVFYNCATVLIEISMRIYRVVKVFIPRYQSHSIYFKHTTQGQTLYVCTHARIITHAYIQTNARTKQCKQKLKELPLATALGEIN